jgi:hypothetical protein
MTLGYLVGLIAGIPLVKSHPLRYVGYTLLLSVALTLICYWKGEKPGWHWGHGNHD